MLMIILDSTVVNVALPSIQRDLGFSQADLAWIVNAYLIAFGGLLLLAGRLGDLLGRRRVFLIGLAVFTAASLLCGAAESQALLIGARFVQGVGGALTSGVILGMIVTMFPKPGDQARAIGVYSFVAAGRRVDRAARRRRADRADQLALDLPDQRPDRDRHRAVRPAAGRARRRARARPRRRRARRRPRHRRADARRLHDPAGGRQAAGAPRRRSSSPRCRSSSSPASSLARRKAANPLVPLGIFRSPT